MTPTRARRTARLRAMMQLRAQASVNAGSAAAARRYSEEDAWLAVARWLEEAIRLYAQIGFPEQLRMDLEPRVVGGARRRAGECVRCGTVGAHICRTAADPY